MAITINSEATGTDSDLGSTASVTKPATVSNDDYLVCIFGIASSVVSAAPNPPADWTTGAEQLFTTGNDVSIGIYYKKVTDAASEPASYTFTNGTGTSAAWWIGALSGIDLTTPEDETMSGNWANRTDDTSPLAATITTVTADAFVLAAYATNFDSATTLNAEWSSRADDVNPGSLICVNVMSTIKVAAGATTGVDISAVAANQESIAGQFAFRPASGAAVRMVPRRMLVGVGS